MVSFLRLFEGLVKNMSTLRSKVCIQCFPMSTIRGKIENVNLGMYNRNSMFLKLEGNDLRTQGDRRGQKGTKEEKGNKRERGQRRRRGDKRGRKGTKRDKR